MKYQLQFYLLLTLLLGSSFYLYSQNQNEEEGTEKIRIVTSDLKDPFENFVDRVRKCDLNGDGKVSYYPKTTNKELKILHKALSSGMPSVSIMGALSRVLLPLDELDGSQDFSIKLDSLPQKPFLKMIYLEKIYELSTIPVPPGDSLQANIKSQIQSFIRYID